jgi:hypothetical protein
VNIRRQIAGQWARFLPPGQVHRPDARVVEDLVEARERPIQAKSRLGFLGFSFVPAEDSPHRQPQPPKGLHMHWSNEACADDRNTDVTHRTVFLNQSM